MVSGRPPLADADPLRIEGISSVDVPLWLAIRRAMASSCGLPGEALHPRDRLADLWRMQWMGPDVRDIIFRLERDLRMKAPRVVIEEAFRASRSVEFHRFAARIVGGLHGRQPAGSPDAAPRRAPGTGRASSDGIAHRSVAGSPELSHQTA